MFVVCLHMARRGADGLMICYGLMNGLRDLVWLRVIVIMFVAFVGLLVVLLLLGDCFVCVWLVNKMVFCFSKKKIHGVSMRICNSCTIFRYRLPTVY